MSISVHWHELVTVALLGTDRRDPPPAPDGAVADIVADSLGDTPAARMLTAIAATTVARRAGVRPGPPAPALAPPPADARPLVTPAAAARWRAIVRDWPVLEDEWLLTVARGGWRLPPDVLVGLLRRHRRDAVRWARAVAVGGPAATWLVEHRPELDRPGRRSAASSVDDPLDELPGLAVAPELVGVLEAGAAAASSALRAVLAAGVVPAQRNVLVNFVARCRPDVLGPLAATLRAAADDLGGPAAGLTHTLADLAVARAAMLTELAAQ